MSHIQTHAHIIHTYAHTHTHTHTCKHTHIQTHTHTHTHIQTGPGWLMDTKGICSSPFLPTQVIMPRFSQHKRDDDRWYSQPFYSQPGGYKLCLCVVANGEGSCRGTHVSASIFLMKGENDHQLQWPFEHVVKYGILNWKRNQNHVISTSDFKNARTICKERVISQERAGRGPGRLNLLSHSSLSDGAAEDIQYLHNDCLCLHVLKAEPPKQ